MGKTKRSRRNFRHNPLSDSHSHESSGGQDGQQSILTDICSLNEARRKKACHLLSNLYSLNSGNVVVLDRLTTPDIFAKLNMRLVDSSNAVRLEAVTALTNISLSKLEMANSRLSQSGIIDAVIALAAENLKEEGSSAELGEKLLDCLSTFVSTNESMAVRFCNKVDALLPSMMQLLSRGLSSDLELAAANLLVVASDDFKTFSQKVISCGGVDILRQRVLDPQDVHSMQDPLRHTSTRLKCMGVLVNIASCEPAVRTEVLVACNVPSLIPSIASLFEPESQAFANILAALVSPSAPSEGAMEASAEGVASEPSEAMQVTKGKARRPKAAGGGAGGVGGDVAALEQVPAYPSIAFDTLKMAAEILTNLVWLLQEENDGALGDDAAMEDDDDDDDEGKGYTEVSMETAGAQSSSSSSSSSSSAGAPVVGAVGAALCDPRVVAGLMRGIHAVTEVVAPSLDSMQVSSSTLDWLETLDRLSACVVNIVGVLPPEALLAPPTPDGTTVVCLDILQEFVRIVGGVSDFVTRISAAAEADPLGACPVDRDLVRDVGVQVVAGAQEALVAVLRAAPPAALQHLANPAVALETSVDPMQTLALLLCRSTTFPSLDVVMTSVEAMAVLAMKDGQVEGQAGGGARTILNTRVNALLSNSVIRCLEEHLAKSTSTGAGAGLIGDGLLVADACLGALMDLHSSDDTEYLQSFAKLNLGARLQACYQTQRELFRSVTRAQGGGGGLDPAQRAKVKETLVNTKRFLAYKSRFLR